MKFIDLFAGIGGIRTAFENHGHECVAFCEINKFAKRSYEAIYESEAKGEKYFEDITTMTEDEWKDLNIDFLVGGFPCQAFSLTGKKLGFEDTRGTLFFEIARGIKAANPNFFVLENVKHLVSHDSGTTFNVIKQTIADLGYTLDFVVLNAKYFGVPQHRERIVMVGWKNDLFYPFLQEIKDTHTVVTTGMLDILQPESDIESKFYMDEFLPYFHEHRTDKPFRFGEQNRVGTMRKGYRTRGEVFDPRGVCKTLTCMEGGGLEPRIFINDRIRKLTPLECWRLQGQPDENFYKAQQVNSNSQLYKEAGNSVAIPMFDAVAKEITNQLKNNVHYQGNGVNVLKDGDESLVRNS